MNYYSRKLELSKKAIQHNALMKASYKQEIENSIKATVIYNTDFKLDKEFDSLPEVQVVDIDSVSAVKDYSFGKTAVLNFASYKNPGGQFLGGSSAQEEALCHASYLYNVLKAFDETFYEWNREHKNKALYLNRGLYSPNIMFNDRYMCDVITVPAPNKSVMYKYGGFTAEENSKALEERIKFVYDISASQGVDTLILGAFGCGVFKQDPHEVASLFKKYLNCTCASKIIFAIPRGVNYDAFKGVFKA